MLFVEMLMVCTYSYWHYSHPSRNWEDFRISEQIDVAAARRIVFKGTSDGAPLSHGLGLSEAYGAVVISTARGPVSPAFPTRHLTCQFQFLENPVICCVSQLYIGSSLLEHFLRLFLRTEFIKSSQDLCAILPRDCLWVSGPSWLPTACSPFLLQKHSTEHVHSSCTFYLD